MVCAENFSGKISGGFVLVPVAELMSVWNICRSRPLGIGDFRTWLASLEMVTRRHAVGAQPTSLRSAELAKLTGSTRSARGGGISPSPDACFAILPTVPDLP
jgi:hypothetical protein